MSKLILVLLFGSFARVTVFPTRKDQRFKFFETRLHLLLLLALSTLQRFNRASELFGELTAHRGQLFVEGRIGSLGCLTIHGLLLQQLGVTLLVLLFQGL